MLDRALALSKADETEALIGASDSSLTRFMHNFVHESVSKRNCQLSVRAVVGKRIGVAGTNKLDEAGIAAVVARAFEIAKISTEDADFPGLPGPADGLVEAPSPFDETTAAATAAMRAAAVNDVTKIMRSTTCTRPVTSRPNPMRSRSPTAKA